MTKNDEMLMNDDVGRDVALVAGGGPHGLPTEQEELERLRAALAEAEALVRKWRHGSACMWGLARKTDSNGAASYGMGWSQAENRCADDLAQALAKAKAGG